MVHIIWKSSCGLQAGLHPGIALTLSSSLCCTNFGTLALFLDTLFPVTGKMFSGSSKITLPNGERCLSHIHMQTLGRLLLTCGITYPFLGESLWCGKEGELTLAMPESCGSLCGWGVWSARPQPKVKGCLRGKGGPCGPDETVVSSTVLGGASSDLTPAFVCVGILMPSFTPLPAPFLPAGFGSGLGLWSNYAGMSFPSHVPFQWGGLLELPWKHHDARALFWLVGSGRLLTF